MPLRGELLVHESIECNFSMKLFHQCEKHSEKYDTIQYKIAIFQEKQRVRASRIKTQKRTCRFLRLVFMARIFFILSSRVVWPLLQFFVFFIAGFLFRLTFITCFFSSFTATTDLCGSLAATTSLLSRISVLLRIRKRLCLRRTKLPSPSANMLRKKTKKNKKLPF